jgi:hypothetical protein
MNSTTRNPHFVPKGCHRAPQDSVTLGAGVQWLQAFKFAASQNITLVGGAPQVGAAGGWMLVRGIKKSSDCRWNTRLTPRVVVIPSCLPVWDLASTIFSRWILLRQTGSYKLSANARIPSCSGRYVIIIHWSRCSRFASLT